MQAATEYADYLRVALEQPPQTNEVGRSAALIGGLLTLSDRFELPIRLVEIGCSAGLNLRADQYRYRYCGGEWGPADSAVSIDDAWRGALPPTTRGLSIVGRHGYDIAPLDAADSEGELVLLSYVWPDQQSRLSRLRGAISVARQVPATLHRCNATDAVTGLDLAEGCLTVLWHSIMWQYLSLPEQSTIAAAIDDIGTRARPGSPFAHLTLEPHRRTPDAEVEFVVRARCWPGGDLRLLAACSPHGPPVVWE